MKTKQTGKKISVYQLHWPAQQNVKLSKPVLPLEQPLKFQDCSVDRNSNFAEGAVLQDN